MRLPAGWRRGKKIICHWRKRKREPIQQRDSTVAEPIPDPNFIFKFRKAYLKDTFYESPNVPRLLAEPKPQQVSSSVQCHPPGDGATSNDAMRLFCMSESHQSRMTRLPVVELQQAGIFEIAGAAPEKLPILLEVRCPDNLIAFARRGDLGVKGGFPQLLIDPVNFHACYTQKLHTNERQAQG